MSTIFNQREAEVHVDPIFLDRWSPRALSPRPVAEEQLHMLFEAARWAPSCSNEQPWLFLYADSGKDLEIFRSLLTERNQRWTDKAPVLAFLLTRKNFARNAKPNDWALFDAGAAWMSLALQARRLGLYAHAMAGFSRDEIYHALAIPQDAYVAICAIAIGRYGDANSLPDEFRKNEAPNSRKPLSEVFIKGKFVG
jgi:nitroreductase